LSLVFLGDDSHGPPRVAYAMTKRVGGAVARNRLRRRLRAQLAELASSGRVPTGALLISVGPDAAHRTPQELRNDVVRLLDALDARRHTDLEAR
jgi:ribonuclease P protein component